MFHMGWFNHQLVYDFVAGAAKSDYNARFFKRGSHQHAGFSGERTPHFLNPSGPTQPKDL